MAIKRKKPTENTFNVILSEKVLFTTRSEDEIGNYLCGLKYFSKMLITTHNIEVMLITPTIISEYKQYKVLIDLSNTDKTFMSNLLELSRNWELAQILEITPSGTKTDVTDEFQSDGKLEDEPFYKTIESFVKKQLNSVSLDETSKKLFVSLIAKLTSISEEIEELKKNIPLKKE